VLVQARQRVGRVAIANSDAGGDAYAHLAIEQAARAVRELTG
jgi:spermidine dehydrogenase